MLLVLVIVFLVRCSTVQTKTMQPALRFGETVDDYVQLPAGIMNTSTSQFTVCSWIKKRYRAKYPVMFEYYLPGSSYHDILLSDNGHYNMVVGNPLTLTNMFTVSDGEWFHACWSWSTVDYTTRVYLNGEMIAWAGTQHRELRTGGLACIGNQAQETKYTDCIFGGDLFKFNIYKRVLEPAEIRILAQDMCTSPEERLAASMILTWYHVLKIERAGSVTAINIHTDCETQQRLKLIEEQINSTRHELSNGQKEMEANTRKDLERTNKDLTVKLDDMTAKLEKSESEFILCGCFT
jgi:cell division protein ZapA (FtsZ GTPase activity inhibitor)